MPAVVGLTFVRVSRRERSAWSERACAVLSDAELKRVASLSDPDTRTRHALGRALIRMIGAEVSGRDAAELEVGESRTGKPWIRDLPALHVNVSHTGSAVIIAACSGTPVGVDIEDPPADVQQSRLLAERRFSAAERNALIDMPEPEFAAWFSRAWTIKEAVGKALGIGVVPCLSQVSVGPMMASAGLTAVAVGPAADSWTLHQLPAPDGPERIAVALPVPGVALEPTTSLTLPAFSRWLNAHGATARRCCASARRRAPI